MCDCQPAEQNVDFGTAYRLLVHLCKFGARPPIIRDMVPSIIKRPLIYTTWQTIHGRKSPTGMIPQDIHTCLSRTTHRLHTTSILLYIEQAKRQNIVKRTIGAFEHYMQIMAGEAIFDFNRVWMIVRAEEAGRIGLSSCPTCGSRFANNRLDASDIHNCPSCALTASRACCRLRAAAAPAPESVEPDDGAPDRGFHSAFMLLDKLCRLGARPPVIRDLVPDVIKRPLIYSTWQIINGRTPPQGQLPQSVSCLLSSALQRFHATAVMLVLSELRDKPLAERMITAYERYRNTMRDETLFDFNRVWMIARSDNCGRLKLARCRCGTRFAYNHEDALDAKACPACSIMAGPGWSKKALLRPPVPAATPNRRLSAAARLK